MDRQAAARIIRDTFENSFDRGRFVNLSKNLFKHLDVSGNFLWAGNRLPNAGAFQPYVDSVERIGKSDAQSKSEDQIDVLIVNLKKETSLERARTRQRNFVARYLEDKQRAAALVAFVPPNPVNWRFSLVRMDYNIVESPGGKIKVETELTPARRYSFLVGEGESSHTAQVQLFPILENDERKPLLSDFEKAFSVEVVTREFFIKYRELFHKVEEALRELVAQNKRIKDDFEAKCVDTVNFAKKLLGQIVFLYFLQKKGWFGVGRDEDWGTGPKNFLRLLFQNEIAPYQNFFNDILESLFYEALAVERTDDFYSRFNCKIPFLNGGLFDPINNYDWVHTDILLANGLFSNTERTKEEDIGTGILDVFDRYNFTVKEDEPLDKEVAVDPEMLGKVFENLLEVKDRKSKGTYYTPREIVHYMCQESLINYLDTTINTGEVPLVATRPPQGKLFGKPDPKQEALKAPGYRPIVPREDIEALVRMGELAIEHDARVENTGRETRDYSYKLSQTVRWNAALIDEKLAAIKVCDPAIGSGAFPVGLMTEIVRARNTLTTYLPDKSGRTNYNFKRHAIQNCLYGVDIDPGAVEIAKLRLWLSIVVDEEDIDQIQPLPNLDYKIVRGNSLLAYPYEPGWTKEIEELKIRFFGTTNLETKRELRNQIDSKLQGFLSNSEKSLGYRVDFDFRIFFSEVFREKGGFDIVIANPPYIQLQKEGGRLARIFQNCGYETFERIGDIYALFYENGMKLLREGGHLCFISSNKWMRAGYGETLRAFFLTKNPLLLVDLGPGVFDNATVDTNILIIQNAENNRSLKGLSLSTEAKGKDLGEFVDQTAVSLPRMTKDAWFIGGDAEQQLKEKVQKIGKPLKDWDVSINYGIKTGLNEAFVIDKATRDRFVAEDPNNVDIIKPVLRGRDIKRYKAEWSGLYMIFIPWHFPLHLDATIQGASKKAEREFERRHPSLYKYLSKYRAELEKRNTAETGTRYEWYALQRCANTYYSEFEKEKIVWPRLMRIHKSEGITFPRFSLAAENVFVVDSLCFLTGSRLRYLLAILNSSFASDYFRKNIAVLDTGGMQMRQQYVENLLIPPITGENRPIVETIQALVGQILLDKERSAADTCDLESQIDQKVYELYGLTPEEIALVEGKN